MGQEVPEAIKKYISEVSAALERLRFPVITWNKSRIFTCFWSMSSSPA
jgi:hypothetical protein